MLLLIYAGLIRYGSKAMTSHYQRDESWGQVRDKSQRIGGSKDIKGRVMRTSQR